MPVYTYHCHECGEVHDAWRKVAQRDVLTLCPRCQGQTVRQTVYRAMVAPDYPEYISPATGKVVRGKQQHLEDLKVSGCRVYEPGETEQFVKRKVERQREYERTVERVVEQAASDIGLA